MKPDSPNRLPGKEDTQLEAEAVARYLAEHHDFFVGREELLADMTVPHASGKAISLLERQVILLRERNAEMERRMREFLGNASANDSLFEKTRIIVLELLKAGTLDELAASVEREMSEKFGAAESRVLFICGEEAAFPPRTLRPYEAAREHLGELFEKKRTFCGEVSPAQAGFLFPGSEGRIACAAIVPIHISAMEAGAREFSAIPVLAVGSENPLHFNKGQDTLFLDFIGEILSALITRLR